MVLRLYFIGILLLSSSFSDSCLVTGACQSCLHAPLYQRLQHHHLDHTRIVPSVVAAAASSSHRQFISTIPSSFPASVLQFLTARRFLLLRRSVETPVALAIGLVIARRCVANLVVATMEMMEGEKNNDGPKTTTTDNNDEKNKTTVAKKIKDDEPVSTAMVATIGIYKNFISPLLPPACRFLPTCSQYGVQAIEEFGPTKGCILTAWRLLRCSPFGGKGYDPPKWPPVAYTYSSY